MSKRRLTGQQKERIQSRQREIISAFEKQGEASGYKKAQVVAKTRSSAILQSNSRQLQAKIRQGVDAIACGDYVLWEQSTQTDNSATAAQVEQQEVAIVAVLPRKTILQRPHLGHGETRPFAANIDCIIIVMAHKPNPRPELIDRYIVIAEAAGIQPVLVYNKIDLFPTEYTQLPEFLDVYTSLGYKFFATSVKTGQGLDKLIEFISDQCSVFAGQSGVGKSTLIQKAVPDQEIQVGQLSANMKGRHTTSTSMLYRLPSGGKIIDTPGVRDIAVWHLKTDIINKGFAEISPYIGHCKFSDCQHTHEPECALKQAVEDNKIDRRRFESYLAIRDSEQ